MSITTRKGQISKVAVIGAAGRMGKWFVRYHANRAAVVSAFDIRTPGGFDAFSNVRVATQLDRCIEDSDAIVICAPVTAMPELIRECAMLAKKGAVLAEISSVKRQSHLALKKIRGDIVPLCLHPMFGPAAGEADLKWILVPVRNGQTEIQVARSLYPSMNIAQVNTWKDHDRAMGIILGLTYAVNLAFADTISKSDLGLLKSLSGTTFAVQSMLAESIVAEEPGLIGAVVSSNPETLKYVKQFSMAFDELKRHVGDSDQIVSRATALNKRLSESHSLEKSYELLYKVVSLLKQAKN
ncbi:MAG: prephenate dehydrogenase/arogenate dehydrogenase family protein [Nitrososphaera sp.]|jgi:prephenate dehydrogenase